MPAFVSDLSARAWAFAALAFAAEVGLLDEFAKPSAGLVGQVVRLEPRVRSALLGVLKVAGVLRGNSGDLIRCQKA